MSLVVDQESLVIGGLGIGLNDDAPWMMRRFVNNPPPRRPDWLESPDADGAVLSRLPKLERMTIEAELELEEAVDMDFALDSLLELIAALDECERLLPGQWVTRTPANSDRTRLTYAQLGEITNLPVTNDGDLQGWLQARPIIALRLECVPYWLDTLRTGPSVTNGNPIQTVDVTPEGNLPAFAIVRYTDAEGQSRSHLEIGADPTDDLARPYLIDSSALSTSGLAGSATTRTGAYSAAGVIRATLTTTPVAICQTAALDLVGTFKGKPRIYGAGSGEISVRVDHRQGDAPFTEGKWVEIPGRGQFYELDGPWLVDAEEAMLGDQSTQIRVVAKSTVPGDTLDVDYLGLMPTSSFYGLAIAPIPSPEAASIFVVRDEFDQAAGNLNGKTLPSGQLWSTAGGATDGAVNATSHLLERSAITATPDTDGRYMVVAAASATVVQVVAAIAANYRNGTYQGVLARYASVNQWFRACFVNLAGDLVGNVRLLVQKRVGGTVTTILNEKFGQTGLGLITLQVSATGYWRVITDTMVRVGFDADLQTGGALASGAPGIYDAYADALAATRRYDNFAGWDTDLERVLFANRTFELHHDTALREAASGAVWAGPPVYRGGYALLQPGTPTRIVAKARRADISVLPDSVIDDDGTLAVDYLPRYSVPA